MQDLIPTRITSEQTGSFTSLEHQEDNWSQNYTSEIIENQK